MSITSTKCSNFWNWYNHKIAIYLICDISLPSRNISREEKENFYYVRFLLQRVIKWNHVNRDKSIWDISWIRRSTKVRNVITSARRKGPSGENKSLNLKALLLPAKSSTLIQRKYSVGKHLSTPSYEPLYFILYYIFVLYSFESLLEKLEIKLVTDGNKNGWNTSTIYLTVCNFLACR